MKSKFLLLIFFLLAFFSCVEEPIQKSQNLQLVVGSSFAHTEWFDGLDNTAYVVAIVRSLADPPEYEDEYHYIPLNQEDTISVEVNSYWTLGFRRECFWIYPDPIFWDGINLIPEQCDVDEEEFWIETCGHIYRYALDCTELGFYTQEVKNNFKPMTTPGKRPPILNCERTGVFPGDAVQWDINSIVEDYSSECE